MPACWHACLKGFMGYMPRRERGVCCMGLKSVFRGPCHVVDRGMALLGCDKGFMGLMPGCGARRGAARSLRVS